MQHDQIQCLFPFVDSIIPYMVKCSSSSVCAICVYVCVCACVHCAYMYVSIDLMLMLRGEVLGNNTNITHDSLGHNNSALLCIVPDRRCCTVYQDNVKADFLWPNGTVVGDAYVTRGRQIVRLHAGNLGSEMRIGKYCCTATLPDLNFDPVCVNVLEV